MSRGPFVPSRRHGPICGARGCTNLRAPGSWVCVTCGDRLATIRADLETERSGRRYNSRSAVPRRPPIESERLDDE